MEFSWRSWNSTYDIAGFCDWFISNHLILQQLCNKHCLIHTDAHRSTQTHAMHILKQNHIVTNSIYNWNNVHICLVCTFKSSIKIRFYIAIIACMTHLSIQLSSDLVLIACWYDKLWWSMWRIYNLKRLWF